MISILILVIRNAANEQEFAADTAVTTDLSPTHRIATLLSAVIDRRYRRTPRPAFIDFGAAGTVVRLRSLLRTTSAWQAGQAYWRL